MNCKTNRVATLFFLVASILPAQTFTSLVSFTGANGFQPQYAALVQGTDGNFYGTTSAGGANNTCYLGCGTVFKVSPEGALTTLHSFDATDSQYPYAGLLLATDGNFYGTTYGSGRGFPTGPRCDCGTIFSVTPGGTLKTLHSFVGTDGSFLESWLVQAENGNLYGTAQDGGANGYGTVFEYTLGGTLTTLLNFTRINGAYPLAGLIQAANGDFYGTTTNKGSPSSQFGQRGTFFRITSGGTLNTFYTFTGFHGPPSGVVQGTDGNFYGTTNQGGPDNWGTVFKISPGGTLTTLHAFDGADGELPVAGLIQANDGNFYGTTEGGGPGCGQVQTGCGYGTIFQITPSGTLTTLHSFTASDGANPVGALVQGTDGDFYGTTEGGGSGSGGTLFRLSAGLAPFVKTLTNIGQVGAMIRILGTDLTGTTSVSFNGAAAVFTVSSPSLITATVPAGATTGPVQVVTPGGTLLSAGSFQVRP